MNRFMVGEMNDAVFIKQEQNLEITKSLAWIAYNGAALVGIAVNDPKRFPTIEEAFPSLFERKEQQDWWIMKQRVEEYAKAKKKQ